MPPPKKKKAGAAKKKGNKGKQPPSPPAEPTPYDNLSLEELQTSVAELQAKHTSLLDAANHAQVEHDAVLSYYEVTKGQLQQLHLETEQAERNIEEAQENHKLELSVYDDRLKRIRYDHANVIKEVDAEGAQALQASWEEFSNRLQDLQGSKKEVVLETHEMQVLHTEEIRRKFDCSLYLLTAISLSPTPFRVYTRLPCHAARHN